MAYAHTHPTRVRSMVLRGVCLFRKREIDWLFGDPDIMDAGSSYPAVGDVGGGGGDVGGANLENYDGGKERIMLERNEESSITAASNGASFSMTNRASQMFPKGWEEFCKGSGVTAPSLAAPKSPSLRSLLESPRPQLVRDTNKNPRTMLLGYYHQLLGSDPLRRLAAAKSWFRWEMGIYSNGFRTESNDSNSSEDGKNGDDSSTTTPLLVWNPHTSAWSYEDALVWNNESMISIDDGHESSSNGKKLDENVAQSLRRYSTAPTPSHASIEAERNRISKLSGFNLLEPIPIEQANNLLDPSSLPSPDQSGNEAATKNNNQTFDPATYIPAQAMLTCYYSANDDYVLYPYNSFLSLAPPRDLPMASWYSSQMPPHPPLLDSSQLSSPSASTTTKSTPSSPLPPCIAIQGGNDAICPPDTALDLHHVWKQLELRIALKSGHSMYDPVIAGEIVKAVDRFGHALLLEDGKELQDEEEEILIASD